ncbi:hypothetical protein F4802DRAFT_308711 [Xylaria palmicola]|nr:hypothetical protein F4802DRAFT_308711 [Xylaria palmicola]
MPTLILRVSLRGLSHGPMRSNLYHNPRRHQSSASGPAPQSAAPAEAKSPPSSRQQAAAKPVVGRPDTPIPVPSVVTPPPFWQRLGPLTRAGQAYARAQRARPWATQVASALVVYLCADLGAQWMSAGGDQRAAEDKTGKGAGEAGGAVDVGKRHDWARTARSLVIGGTAAIPGYMWYTFLARSFNYSSTIVSIAVKVAINQCLFTPIFNVYFFGAQALLSGDTAAEAWRRVCNTVPVSFVNSCKLWPAVTAFNFAFIPFEYRSVFGGVVAVGWQTYLSFLNARAERLEALRQREGVAGRL